MSTRYSAFMSHGTAVIGDSESKFIHMSCDEVAERMNDMQRVVNTVALFKIEVEQGTKARRKEEQERMFSALEGLCKKTTGQLLAELLDAADDLAKAHCETSWPIAQEAYKAAKKAYEESL